MYLRQIWVISKTVGKFKDIDERLVSQSISKLKNNILITVTIYKGKPNMNSISIRRKDKDIFPAHARAWNQTLLSAFSWFDLKLIFSNVPNWYK